MNICVNLNIVLHSIAPCPILIVRCKALKSCILRNLPQTQ